MQDKLKVGDIVVVPTKSMSNSNTMLVDRFLENGEVLLKHPFSSEVFMVKNSSDLDNSTARPKGDIERSIEFLRRHSEFLDYTSKLDLNALCIAFIVQRNITPRQKNVLSAILGDIANIRLNGSITEAINYVVNNEKLLDEFNNMWYVNFKKLFSGEQQITSKKQRSVIFNIAGFVMSELENSSL